jgi:hypothetical protein
VIFFLEFVFKYQSVALANGICQGQAEACGALTTSLRLIETMEKLAAVKRFLAWI